MAFVGAAPVTMQTLRHFQSINIPLYELFGMSESGGPHTISVPGRVLSGSCGMALEGMETKVTSDEDGNGEVKTSSESSQSVNSMLANVTWS